MYPKLVIWGAGGHASVVADIIRLRGNYEIVGFLDDINPQRHTTEFCGAEILGGSDKLDALKRGGVNSLIVAVGDCETRARLFRLANQKFFSLVTAVHPRAIIANDIQIGAGTVIAAGAVVNPGCRIGSNVIINTSASVDHESVIGDAAHISPGVHLGGKVSVGSQAWVGIGATVADRVQIGTGSVIGAGAVVLNDIPNDVVALGVPAKVIRKVKINE